MRHIEIPPISLIRPISSMLAIPHIGTLATPLFLAQTWQETPELTFAPATAHLHWSETHLHLQLEFTDNPIFSASTAHCQDLFRLGDTAEVFLMLPDAPHYYELHVSPHNHRTFFRWPLGAIDRVRSDGLSLNDFKENPDAFQSSVQLLENGWNINFDIPHSLLDLANFKPGQRLRVSICRYDYRDLLTPPILSTVSSHKVKNYHLTEDWLAAELV